MAQNKFKGLGIALITPFKADGTIDWEALDRLVEYQLKSGASWVPQPRHPHSPPKRSAC